MNEREAQQVIQVLKDLDHTSFLHIALVVIGAWLLTGLTQRGFPWLAQRVSSRLRLRILQSIPVLRLLILVLALGLIVSIVLNPNLPSLVAVLGASALAIGFALKDYVNGLVAGLVAIFERPYRTGDWVKINDAYGEVVAVGLRTLRLVTPDDTVVTIPHAKVWDTNIYNSNDGKRNLLCVVHFHLHPLHDAVRVRQRLYDVALTSPYLQLERPIVVVVSERPWDTHYQVKAYPIDARQQFQFMSDITVRAKTALSNLGVEPATIPPPIIPPPVKGESFYP